jgi:hypothetical protein
MASKIGKAKESRVLFTSKKNIFDVFENVLRYSYGHTRMNMHIHYWDKIVFH